MRKALIIFYLNFALWLLALPARVEAQSANLQFRRFEEGSPLNGNAVFATRQDEYGFLWFGTYKGLYRYDGYSFKSFAEETNDLKILSQSPVTSLAIDHDNCAWAEVSGVGIICFDIKTNRVVRKILNHDATSNYKIKTLVTCIIEDKDKDIWFSTRGNGVFRWQRKSGKLDQYTILNPIAEYATNYFETVKCDESGKIWFGSNWQGLFYFDKLHNKIEKYQADYLLNKPVFDIQQMGSYLYILDKYDIIKLDPATGKFTFLVKSSENKGYVGSQYLYRDKQGLLWIATEKKGLWLYNETNNTWLKYTADVLDAHSLVSNSIINIFEDHSGNIWINTEDGTCVLTPMHQYINAYTKTADSANSLSNKHVKAIYQDSAFNIWVGIYDGALNKIDPERKITHFQMKEMVHYQNIYSIFPRKNGNILVSTLQGYREFDTRKNRFIHTFHTEISSVFVWDIFENDDGRVWMGTNLRGLIIHDPSKNTKEEYLKGECSVWRIFKDKDHNIWLGTNKGLMQVKFVNGKPLFKAYPYNSKNDQGLHGKNIFDIYEDASGILWLATTEAGLNRFDKSKGTFEAFDHVNGFTSDCICGILQDEVGLLWLSTENGICVFDPSMKRVIYRFNKSDGFLSDDFSYCCRFKNAQGKMYFGNQVGFNSFNPSELKKCISDLLLKKDNLAITSFKTLYSNYSDSVVSSHTISLSYKENTVFIDFALMDFTNPQQNQFSYKLEGLDTAWYYAGNHHYTSFTNLSPGRYLFLLRGRVANTPWGNNIFKFYIVIRPPYWRTWWFILIIMLCAASLLWAIGSNFIKVRKIKRQQVKMELAALRAQLNPHFIFNSLTALENFIVSDEKLQAIKYLSRFSKLMRMILVYSRKETISLKEEIDFLELYFFMETVRAGHKFPYTIKVESKVSPEAIEIPPMLLQPFVENSILHGLVTKKEDGYINILFRQNENVLYCIIEDNGIGRQKAENNKTQFNSAMIKESIGIKIISERLNLLYNSSENAGLEIIDLKNSDGEPTGTKIIIKIPLQSKTDRTYVKNTDNR